MQHLVSSAVVRFALELESLEGITIFGDYQRGVSEFETGFENNDGLSASNEGAVGVGMTPLVLRDGVLRSHVLLPRQVAEKACTQDASGHARKARYTVVHELAHCDDHKKLADRFAAELMDNSARRNVLDIGCRATWSEYYVCRTVAKECPEMLADMEEVIVRTLQGFEVESKIAKHYAAQGDKQEAQRHAVSAGFNLFIVLARLLGHLDGLGLLFKDGCKIAPAYLSKMVQDADVEQLCAALNKLWNERGRWKALSDIRAVWSPLATILNKI